MENMTLWRRIKFNRRSKKQVLLSRSKFGNFGILIFLLAFCSFMALPMLYAIIQSLKPIDEIFLYPPRFYVKNPTFDNFVQVIDLAGSLWVPFTRYLFNSLFITSLGTFVYLVFAAMAGYSLAKGKFKGCGAIGQVVTLTLLFRAEVTVIPAYFIVAKLGMIDTYWALLLPPLAGSMGVFLIRQFATAAIEDSTLEAARIDGASEYKIFSSIVIPSIKPALLTTVIFTFQSMWNSAGTSQYIFSESLKELPTVLSTIAAGGIARQGAASAVAVVLMIPPIAVFLFSQSSVMDTMTHSGMK